MTPELLALAFGGLSALSWGSGDFNGGLATKRLGVLHVLTVVHGVGLVLTLLLALLTRQALPPTAELALAAGAGVIGLISLGALYRGLAEGQMGIAAPVSSVLSAALPLIFSIVVRGTQPDSAQQIGFAIALVAIVLISLASGKIEGTSGLGMAVTAGIGFGIYFILMSFIQSDSVYWLAAVSRALTFGMLLMIVIRQRRILAPPNGLTGVMLLLAGVLDVFGNIFFLLSAQSGRLDIAAVVVALYPAVTIVLAAGLLKERMSRLQVLGVVLALGAVALIAA
ncbi:MAG: DMT family transporter [Anaerolineae bacterium]|nr:DMT family transporter [Anaerolineae bacterium]